MASDARRYFKKGSVRSLFAAAGLLASAYAASTTFSRHVTEKIVDTPLSESATGKALVNRGLFPWERARCETESRLPPEKAPPAQGYMASARKLGEKAGIKSNRLDIARTPDQLYIDCLRREVGSPFLSPQLAILGFITALVTSLGLAWAYRGAAFFHLSYKTAYNRPYLKFKDPPAAPEEKENGPLYTATFVIGKGYKPIVSADLPPKQSVYAERGALLARSDAVEINTYAQDRDRKGLGKLFARTKRFLVRMVAGEGPVLMQYENAGEETAEIHLNTDTQTIVPVRLTPEEGLIVQRGGFYGATAPVSIDPVFVRDFSFIVFGRQGMFLQQVQVKDAAEVLLESPGHVLERTLKEGQVLKVQPDSLFGFTTTVSLALAENRKLLKRLTHGEGMFDIAVKGPGRVWMQTERAQRTGWLSKFLPG
jgi:uncharacterized protein (AIM24 family)